MRALHVIAPGVFGGLERVVQMLADRGRHAGLDVHVAVVVDPLSVDHPILRALAAVSDTHPVVVPGRAYRRERAALSDLCGRLRPDVMHTHGYRADIVDAGVARRLRIPTVTTVHGFTGGNWKNRLYEGLQRRALRQFDAVVAVSRSLAERLKRSAVPADRVHVVQNAWSGAGGAGGASGAGGAPLLARDAARRALNVPVEGFRIGWVGRLSREKGADVLLDALTHLTDVSCSVSIVGEGGERWSLEARARRLGVERQVRWHGGVADASRFFAAFDVFVLSSRTEGTPIVLFEAMAASVPIIAARVGGVPDVVSPAEAILVSPDDPAALAEAIRAVSQDSPSAGTRAHRARARLLTDFAPDPWIERYQAIYQEIVSTPRARCAV